jgi:hypothetical protein
MGMLLTFAPIALPRNAMIAAVAPPGRRNEVAAVRATGKDQSG